MKTFILTVGLALAVVVIGPAAESRLLAQGPKNRIKLENVNLTGLSTRSVAFSPDGKSMAAAYFDGPVQLWDVANGKNIATFTTELAICSHCVAFSPDGKTLAALQGSQIILLDVASGKKTGTLKKGGYGALAFSPDGKLLASGGAETVLWDVASGKVTAILGPSGRSLAFSPDGKLLAGVSESGVSESGKQTGEVTLWDVASGKSIAILKDEAPVWCVAISSDNKTLATGDAKTVRLWNTATGKKTATLSALTENLPEDCVHSVAFSPDGKTVAAGSMCVIKFWNVATGKRTANFTAHPHWVHAIAFSPDGKNFASATEWGGDPHALVKLWDLSLIDIAKPGREVIRDSEAIEKVVRSYVGNQCKPSTCEQNIGLCLEDAVHSVVWKGEAKVNRATVREVVAFAKKTFTEDHQTTVESVKVEVHGKTGLAVAFVQFHHVGVNCHDVITLALRDGTWKIVSIVQENLEPK